MRWKIWKSWRVTRFTFQVPGISIEIEKEGDHIPKQEIPPEENEQSSANAIPEIGPSGSQVDSIGEVVDTETLAKRRDAPAVQLDVVFNQAPHPVAPEEKPKLSKSVARRMAYFKKDFAGNLDELRAEGVPLWGALLTMSPFAAVGVGRALVDGVLDYNKLHDIDAPVARERIRTQATAGCDPEASPEPFSQKEAGPRPEEARATTANKNVQVIEEPLSGPDSGMRPPEPQKSRCWHCNGTGYVSVPTGPSSRCPNCNGMGSL